MEMKKIWAIDAVLIVGTLIAVFVLIDYAQPLVIAPTDDFTTTETKVLFEFAGEKILIDDNLEFNSPDEYAAKDGLIINLKPGVYYWKAVRGFESETRKLTIESEIDLRLNEKGDGEYEIVNAGNVELDVEVYRDDELVGSLILGSGEKENAEGDKFFGRENE